MGKQEIFILTTTFIAWLLTLTGRPFIGLIHYQLYALLQFSLVFPQFQWIRMPFTTAVITFIVVSVKNTKNLFISPQAKLMVALFFYMCLSRYFNGHEIFGHKYMHFFYKAIFAHFLIINIIDTKAKLKLFLWMLAIGSAALAFAAGYHDTEKAYLWMNRNDFAGDLVAGIAFPIFFALSWKKLIPRIEAVCYFAIILLGIAGTNSRGGYLALAIVLILLLITNFTFKRLLILIFLVVVVFSRVSSTHWERFYSTNLGIEQGGTGGQRIAAWKSASRMMIANPLLGVGAGEFPNNFPKYATAKDFDKLGGYSTNTHNTFFQIGAENGFVGLGIFMLIVLIAYKNLANVLRLCRGDPESEDLRHMVMAVGISITGYLVAGQFGNYGYYFTLYTLLSLPVVIKRLSVKTAIVDNKDEEGTNIIETVMFKHQMIFRILLFAICTYMCLQL